MNFQLFGRAICLLSFSLGFSCLAETGNVKRGRRPGDPKVSAPPISSGDSEVTRPGTQNQNVGAPLVSKPSPVIDEAYKPVGLGPGDKVSKACESAYLSHKGGVYGPRAKVLMEEIYRSPMKHLFLTEPVVGLEEICPGFSDIEKISDSKLRENQKMNFWVALFTRIAFRESSCRPHLFGTCLKGQACGGELQMEEDWEKRYSRKPRDFRSPTMWLKQDKLGCRSDFVKPPEKSFWSTNVRNNLSCGVEIMGGTLCGFYRTNEGWCTKPTSPFFSAGYWEKVNTGVVGEQMKKFPLCKGEKNEPKFAFARNP